MATFNELYGNALDVQLNSADRTELFTTARRKHEVNEAEREFARQTECFVKQSTITLSTAVVAGSTGVAEVDLSSAVSDFLWVSGQQIEVRNSDTNSNVLYYSGDDIPRRHIEYLNRHDPGWRTGSPATPDKHYLREDGKTIYLGLVPAPKFASTSDSWSLVVPYVAWPSSMTSDTNVPFSGKTHLRPWHQALVHFAASRLYSLRGDDQAAERQAGMFAGYVADYQMRQRPKGGSAVQFDRNYRRERASRWDGRDPRVDW